MSQLQPFPWLWLILLAHGVYWFTAFPNPDEAYYWLWGQHLDWSYYDHPPFHAWVQGMFSRLGHSPFVLRLPTVVSNGLFFWTYYQIAGYLYGERAHEAWFIVVRCCWSSPLYFLFLTLAWHDQWLLAFSLLSAYWLVRFLDGVWLDGRGRSGYLYGAAIMLGLAGLCKYTAVFVGLTALGVIVSQPKLRPLLQDGRLYGAVAIASLFTLPILIWNIQNDWLSFQYYLTRSVDSGGGPTLRPDAVIFFWLTAALILSPPLVWALVRAVRVSTSTRSLIKSPTYRTMALGLFTTSTGILSLVGLFSTAFYYWNILAYLLLLPLLPLVFPGGEATLRHRRWLNGMQVLGTAVAWLLVINYCVLPLAALVGPNGDPDGRMSFGWRQVAAVVQGYAPQHELLLTTDYRSASALAYGLNNKQVLAISHRRDQFDVWAKSRVLKGRSALVLADDWHPFIAAGALRLEPGWEQVATISVKRFGVKIKDYYLYSGIYAGTAEQTP
ncbi:glycosyltransferase family 39 protein [Leptolyngbya cf. ectocarpi LEGE 11479]|uniref:Glycosyltransferase family 39 protein n=1 Tax=Leptolyngbya cf. ectocarpi LEGE 11479 TaxID=1828722 RepID=A0A928X1U7_LEPEC|nr:glycosyltransferase family 39 protein [Leptolyngbya ectocarpi]MBE9065493.1 glycosyltransferase family 39 protein [Leptolyngbya cf. ectocarpi LEGE 11479]